MSLVDHPLWPEVRLSARAECTARPGPWRLEVTRPSHPAVVSRWLAIQVPCAACHRLMHPIRRRPDGSLRIAVACAHTTNEGCSKGWKATQEVERIASLLHGHGPRGKRAWFD